MKRFVAVLSVAVLAAGCGTYNPEAFTESGECGEAFTVSDEEKTQLLIVTFDIPADGLPSGIPLDKNMWAGELVLGQNLEPYTCDDVLPEGWEPPDQEKILLIDKGTLVLNEPLPSDGNDDSTGFRSATLTDAKAGEYYIGNVELENSSWGFYGG